MRYFLSEFDKQTGELVREMELPPTSAYELARLLGVSPGDFIESYQIGEAEAEFLHEKFGIEIYLNCGDYFVEVFQSS